MVLTLGVRQLRGYTPAQTRQTDKNRPRGPVRRKVNSVIILGVGYNVEVQERCEERSDDSGGKMADKKQENLAKNQSKFGCNFRGNVHCKTAVCDLETHATCPR